MKDRKTMVCAFSQSGNTFMADGDVDTTIDDWAATVTLDGTTYGEVVNGTWTLSFSGADATD